MICTTPIPSTNLGFSEIRMPLISNPLLKYTLQTSMSVHVKTKPRFVICRCSDNENKQRILKGFSLLETDAPWESGSVWTSMALYFFSLHIPMSFGGLSVVAQMLDQPNLEPEVKAMVVLVIEILELFGALLLLQLTARPHYMLVDLFKSREMQTERNWVLASLMGFLALDIAIYLTSFLADRLFGAEGVNDQAVKEILSSGIVSQAACITIYCVVAPLLEEIVYRGFLLASLAPTMQWYQAVVLSSVVFSAAHLSMENFVQLFIIGLVLGSSYCWTGDLKSSILLHCLYNALTLFITFIY